MVYIGGVLVLTVVIVANVWFATKDLNAVAAAFGACVLVLHVGVNS